MMLSTLTAARQMMIAALILSGTLGSQPAHAFIFGPPHDNGFRLDFDHQEQRRPQREYREHNWGWGERHGFVNTYSYDESTGNYHQAKIKGDYAIRQQPNISGRFLGVGYDGLRSNSLSVTGRRNGSWVEVNFRGQRAWMHRNALVGSESEQARPAPQRSTANEPMTKAAGTAVKPKKETPKNQNPSKPKSKPECVQSFQQLQKNPKFTKHFKGDNPFTTWNGGPDTFGATIVFNGSRTVLNHPLHGAIPLRGAAICVDGEGIPYGYFNGQKIPLSGPRLSVARVKDPTSGSVYTFSRPTGGAQ